MKQLGVETVDNVLFAFCQIESCLSCNADKRKCSLYVSLCTPGLIGCDQFLELTSEIQLASRSVSKRGLISK